MIFNFRLLEEFHIIHLQLASYLNVQHKGFIAITWRSLLLCFKMIKDIQQLHFNKSSAHIKWK